MKKSFFFVHIEKTAGITLNNIFINNFQFYTSLKPWFYYSNNKYLTNDKFNTYIRFLPFKHHGLGGHTIREFEQYSLKRHPVFYITFLRDPIKRYLSHFYYQKDFMNVERSFEEFLSDEYYSNFITKRISKSGSIHDAKVRLKNYAFVGLIEEFDKSLILMNKIVFENRLDIHYESTNIGKSKDKYAEILNNYYDRIIKNNRLDIALYKYAKEEIYSHFSNVISESEIEFKIRELNKQINDFQFSRTKLMLNKVYRYLIVFPVDYLANHKTITRKG